jgi:hypothetical protein
MKNLNVFNGNTHDFLDDIISSKNYSHKDPTYKQRVNVLSPNVKLCYNTYDVVHNGNNHVALVPHGYINGDKEDLIKLYNPKAKKLVKFKNDATTILDNRASTVCQYCTINSANTLDHIVPKSNFAEFAVNPKNLLPACSECNGYKLDRFVFNNSRLFLNLYTDILPPEQYLFVDVKNINGDIEADYRLSDVNINNAPLFALIESHYDRLYLFRRFKIKTNTIISEFVNSITSAVGVISREAFIQITLDKINKDKAIHGNNHYGLILQESLVSNVNFINLYF